MSDSKPKTTNDPVESYMSAWPKSVADISRNYHPGPTDSKPLSDVELVAMAMYIGPNVDDLNIPNEVLRWKADRSVLRAAYRSDARRIIRALKGQR